mmetsp:Transcript_40450/g.49063  ORF Transcript_40450/g.49063 Transcript_40450/m.49063 type:complete len:91 (-) Transcript_40450:606-878(-)
MNDVIDRRCIRLEELKCEFTGGPALLRTTPLLSELKSRCFPIEYSILLITARSNVRSYTNKISGRLVVREYLACKNGSMANALIRLCLEK